MQFQNKYFDERTEIIKQILCKLNFMEKEEILNLYWNLHSMKRTDNININIKNTDKKDFSIKLRGRKRRRQFNNTLLKLKKISYKQ